MPFGGNNQPDLDGGSGGRGPTGGGGNPGTPSGSSQGIAFPAGEIGGVIGSTYFLFIPVQNIQTGACYIATFDVTNFDDKVDGSSYSWRQEDVKKDRVPTVNRAILTYRDLGLCLLTLTIFAVNDKNQIISRSVQVQIGNRIPTNELMTQFIDISLSGFRPRPVISRAAAGGPFCITGLTLRGEVEENQ